MSELIQIEPEYVYVTIPAEYICVYHRILAMLADYGEDMLKDCKASCTDRNSNVIDCFNMFNAAVAARKLGKDKLAETLIKYIKAKINQMYRGVDNSTSFVFPVDENGQLKAFVSCNERPMFHINPEDGELYEHKFGNGFEEHFGLGDEDNDISEEIDRDKLIVTLDPRYDVVNDITVPCADISIKYDNIPLTYSDVTITYYFDDEEVPNFKYISELKEGNHTFMIVVNYKGVVKIVKSDLIYEGS
ncbi:hypothetical protein [Clostridium sp.]|uniref:hypothetical protein n=1 Tax=Clostridium sp. TaxID=1506 RepID=UPI0025C6DBA1|nr:hypothetical protein [Clostridium sp.]